jgi:hypothetical protein
MGKELRLSQDGFIDQSRLHYLMSFLHRHAKSEPDWALDNIFSQDRLSRSQLTHKMRGTLAPHENLEEERGRAEQEQEQE